MCLHLVYHIAPQNSLITLQSCNLMNVKLSLSQRAKKLLLRIFLRSAV